MTTIEDLKYKPINEMTIDESIEQLRQLRLSRRTPVKKVRSKPASRSTTKSIVKNLDKESINELLDMIGDK